MRRLAAIAAICAILPVTLHTQQRASASIAALRRWVEAVNSHAPGRPDEAVAAVAPLTYEQRVQLNAGMELFFKVLQSESVKARDDAAKETAAIARAIRDSPGAAVFLERAALLHTDAVVFGDRFPVPLDDVPRPARDRVAGDTRGAVSARRVETPPPLLSIERLVLDKDGEVLGEMLASWHWPFARFLLDNLMTVGNEEDAAFVRAWYHAVSAYMFAEGFYGEATSHLPRASALFPNDADILFDRGCYAEILGLPIHQVMSGETSIRIPSGSQTNDEAEKLFARAVQVNPAHAEARIRMARLLGLRGRHEAAAAELDTALAAKPAGAVAFYAHLFAGRETQALGRLEDAAAHYREASALFPSAQSALLAASQVALLQGDLATVLAPVRQLGRGSASGPDPWWDYRLASGRDADALFAEMWQQVSALPRKHDATARHQGRKAPSTKQNILKSLCLCDLLP